MMSPQGVGISVGIGAGVGVGGSGGVTSPRDELSESNNLLRLDC